MQVYSDPSREADKWALPDVEVFYMSDSDIRALSVGNGVLPAFTDDNYPESGWYYWYCLPGCLPDSDPFGPFATEADAIAAAQED